MKTKLDFITNSSSASIYLIIKSNHESLDEFKNSFNKFIDEYLDGEYGMSERIHFWDPSEIKMERKGIFKIGHFTSMFNYATTDIPHYMQVLFLESVAGISKIDMENRYGFKEVKLEVVDEH